MTIEEAIKVMRAEHALAVADGVPETARALDGVLGVLLRIKEERDAKQPELFDCSEQFSPPVLLASARGSNKYSVFPAENAE